MTDEVILNVDDQEPERYIKRRDLEASGFTVVDAMTGAEALRLIEQIKPAVVLLDVQLPDISGYEVCRYIKSKWSEVMVLMTSATFTASDRRALGLDAGADSYLVQPAEPLELTAAVNAMLRIRRSEDALRNLNVSLDAQVKEQGTALSRAINALRASADRTRTLLQATYIFQGYMTADGTLLDANRASLEGIGAKFEDVVGRPYWETPWFAATPGMPDTIRKAVERAAAGEIVQQSMFILVTCLTANAASDRHGGTAGEERRGQGDRHRSGGYRNHAAAQSGSRAATINEDGGDRPVDRRPRPRFQQSIDWRSSAIWILSVTAPPNRTSANGRRTPSRPPNAARN